MPSKQRKNNKGFTIIEVVLVLAIAGLIFLMVFVAFPALQRSQNDTQRQNDIARLSTQITNFKTNNTNGIPGKAAKNDNLLANIIGAEIDSAPNINKRGTWAYFYKKAAGEDCKAAAQRYSSTFAAQDHTILVVLGAKCDGEATVASAGYIKNNRSVRATIFIKLH